MNAYPQINNSNFPFMNNLYDENNNSFLYINNLKIKKKENHLLKELEIGFVQTVKI